MDKLPLGEYYDQGAVNVVTVREPFGVVAGILPYVLFFVRRIMG